MLLQLDRTHFEEARVSRPFKGTGIRLGAPERIRAKGAGIQRKRHLFSGLAEKLRDAVCANNIWQSSMCTTDGRHAWELANAMPEKGSAWEEVLLMARSSRNGIS